ncbi:MAG: PleD family two-component system response regulator [Anaerolineales bacterium]
MPKKVVYIEDEPEMVDLVQMMLQGPDVETYPALSGESGLDTLQQIHPDLILLDLFMPDISGWDIYRRIRANEQLRDTPVIVLSACHEKIASALGEDVPSGAFDYICKPFSPAELRHSVDRALGLHQ